jgi:hypothetical protein
MSKPSSTVSESIRDVPHTTGVMVATASHILAKGTILSLQQPARVPSLEFARGSFTTRSDEHVDKLAVHSQLLIRHLVIKSGVHIDPCHLYRLPDDLLST